MSKTSALKANQGLVVWAAMIGLTIVWGSSFILMKKGLVAFSPVQVGSLRMVTAGLFLAPMAIKRLRGLPRRDFLLLLLPGYLGSFIPAILFSIAQTRIDSAVAGILNALTPLFVLVVGLLFFNGKATRMAFLGLLAGFGGTAVLILAGSGGDVSSVNAFGLLIVLATICYGFNVNIIKVTLGHLPPLTLTAVSLFQAGVGASAYLLLATDFIPRMQETEGAWRALGYLTILGVLGTAIAMLVFNWLIKTTTAVFSSSVTYLIPIVAVLWGLLDGESLIILQFVGMAFIIGGVYLVNMSRQKKK